MSTDLAEIVRERLAAKARQGKRPTHSDLIWLEATQPPSVPASSVELERVRGGEMLFKVKVGHIDPYAAEAISKEIANRLRATYPMNDGTVGSPMVPQKAEKKAKS